MIDETQDDSEKLRLLEFPLNQDGAFGGKR